MNESTFDEAEYLVANPDVAVAIKNGMFRSGQEHFQYMVKKRGVC